MRPHPTVEVTLSCSCVSGSTWQTLLVSRTHNVANRLAKKVFSNSSSSSTRHTRLYQSSFPSTAVIRGSEGVCGGGGGRERGLIANQRQRDAARWCARFMRRCCGHDWRLRQGRLVAPRPSASSFWAALAMTSASSSSASSLSTKPISPTALSEAASRALFQGGLSTSDISPHQCPTIKSSFPPSQGRQCAHTFRTLAPFTPPPHPANVRSTVMIPDVTWRIRSCNSDTCIIRCPSPNK